MADYNNYKIEIFTGINDVAVNPSSTSGGNISHLYDIYNQLIDAVTNDVTNLENQISILQAQLPTAQIPIDIYTYENINTAYSRGIYEFDLGTVPKTGKLIKLIITGSLNDPYRIYFNIDGVYRYFTDYQKFSDRHEFLYAVDNDVTLGTPLKFRNRVEELNLTISLFIEG